MPPIGGLNDRCGPGAPQRAHSPKLGAYPATASDRSRKASSTSDGVALAAGQHPQAADQQQVLLDGRFEVLTGQPVGRLEHRRARGVAR